MTTELRSIGFRREREAVWFELEDIVIRAEKGGLRNLPADDLSRLPVLYRATLSSLSTARSISLDRNLLNYLESLCNRAYVLVYSTRKSLIEVVREFLTTTFPVAVRELGYKVGLSTILLLLGTVTGAAVFALDPEFFYTFVPGDLANGRGPAATTESLREVLFDDGGGETAELALFASFLVSHNAKIGMMCFALGIAAAFPVVYLLFSNGLTLGAFYGLYASRDLEVEFLSWVLPHGITELLAVILCGAAGLHIGQAVAFPGEHSRMDTLKLRGRTAGAVVIGAVIMFFIAAIFEGFFRQQVQSVDVRFIVASSTAIFWLAYLGFGGRT